MQTLKNILILIAAAIAFVPLSICGVLVTFALLFIKDNRERYTNFADYPFSIAYCIDLLGNVVCGDFFNIVLIKHGGYKYGTRGETISSATGRNVLLNTLTITGLLVNKFLDFAFIKGHSVQNIQPEFNNQN